ncbi:MAG: sigma 54-interacting transcriptional regulator [Thermincola sp.]|nr:sigma 54-interacting transcriptional regulator [Thermincola sp.]MDT3703545.1 sigma 54-interacting transcriptional regulator [Thermincola sp.]
MLRVGQVMTRLSICLYHHNTIGDALALMKEKKVEGLPVVNEQARLLGMVTKEQILERALEGVTAGDKAIDFVTARYLPLKEDALLEDVWDLPFDIFPVLNQQEEITGVVSKYALGQAYFQHTYLRRQELEAVFNSTHNGIIAINKHGIITSLNPAAEEPTRSTGEEAVGRFLNEVVVPTGLLDVVRTGTPEFGVKFKVGRRQYITNRTPIIKDGEVIGAVGVFQDVSELELISKELRSVVELNEELGTIVDSSFDGIIICNSGGKIQRCNPAVERVLGVARKDLVGKPFRELIEKGILTNNIINMVKKEGGPVRAVESPSADNSLVISGNPVHDEDGVLSKIIINIRDMTELEGLREALEESQLLSLQYQSEIAEMRTHLKPPKEIEYCSEVMRNVFDLALRVSQVESPVVLIGESGVCKGDIGRFIHLHSERRKGPFLKINCASVPEQVLETELFGYTAGSFAGASNKDKPGLFELADLGTLYLEEIGELTLALQAKLLRVLQDKEVMPLGGRQAVPVNVRIIAATLDPLTELVKRGTFKEELFFHLNVVPIKIPPLRERNEDVLSLLQYYLADYNNRYSLDKELSPETVTFLLNYEWPGNVRELANVVERLVVTAKGKLITLEEVGAVLGRQEPEHGKTITVAGILPLKEAVDEVEQILVTMAMTCYGTTIKAAEALGVNQSTVVRKLQKIKDNK